MEHNGRLISVIHSVATKYTCTAWCQCVPETGEVYWLPSHCMQCNVWVSMVRIVQVRSAKLNHAITSSSSSSAAAASSSSAWSILVYRHHGTGLQLHHSSRSHCGHVCRSRTSNVQHSDASRTHRTRSSQCTRSLSSLLHRQQSVHAQTISKPWTEVFSTF